MLVVPAAHERGVRHVHRPCRDDLGIDAVAAGNRARRRAAPPDVNGHPGLVQELAVAPAVHDDRPDVAHGRIRGLRVVVVDVEGDEHRAGLGAAARRGLRRTVERDAAHVEQAVGPCPDGRVGRSLEAEQRRDRARRVLPEPWQQRAPPRGPFVPGPEDPEPGVAGHLPVCDPLRADETVVVGRRQAVDRVPRTARDRRFILALKVRVAENLERRALPNAGWTADDVDVRADRQLLPVRREREAHAHGDDARTHIESAAETGVFHGGVHAGSSQLGWDGGDGLPLWHTAIRVTCHETTTARQVDCEER